MPVVAGRGQRALQPRSPLVFHIESQSEGEIFFEQLRSGFRRMKSREAVLLGNTQVQV